MGDEKRSEDSKPSLPGRIKDFIQSYVESYRRGREKFGVWWTLFTVSMWLVVLIFLSTAMIIAVVYL